MYAGFDVFDTLLGRKVSPPTAVFNLLGKRLNETNQLMIPPNLFANERINAERRCYQNLGHQTNLNDIYRELLESLPNIKATAQDLEKTEFLIEKEITFPIAHHKNILDRCREEGKKIVFISDTYLHTECIEILLRHHEIFLDGDRIFTSCDAGASKSTSKLFEYALKTLGIDPESIIFY